MLYDLLKGKRVIMCVGDMDTGKTNVVASLVEEHKRKGEALIHMDLDMGQSTIGPPTTIGLRMPDGEERLYFVGNTSPFGVFKEIRNGLALFKELLGSSEAHRVIVDTPGLARGIYAWLLARTEIEMLGVEMVVVLQRAGEAAPVIEQLEKRGIGHVVLEAHKEVRPRSVGERRGYRDRLFEQYFRDARTMTISTARRKITTMGRQPEEGLLAGLLDEKEFVVCLGIFEGVAKRGIQVVVPKCTLRMVKQIRFGRYVLGVSRP